MHLVDILHDLKSLVLGTISVRDPVCHTHNIAGFAVSLLLHGIKGLPSELGTTGHADEAVHVEDLVHGGTTRPFTDHILPTARTSTCKIQQWNYCMDADGK